MSNFVECVPNFSEGRDESKINRIVEAAKAVSGVIILDVEKDPDHNRTVLTFVSPPETAVEAMFRVAQKSAELIDLNRHKGEHPRMGALDVAPFIPVMGVSLEVCVDLAVQLARRIGEELNIPAYLYDRAARVPERANLAKVRKGQFEGLKELIGKDPSRKPDFGPEKIHPTAGAVAVGARQQIINFNVNLDTADMDFGKALAKKIRTSGGGLPALRGAAIFLESKNQVQISTVLTDYKTTSIKRVMNEIEREIKPKNIKITGTELIGMTTQDAITDYAVETLGIENFSAGAQLLENRFLSLLGTWQVGANILSDALASDDPTPGGGSAAAVAGAMGCALGGMAAGVTLMSKKTPEENKPKLSGLKDRLTGWKGELQNCAAEDSRAFNKFMEARKLPKDSPERKGRMQEALKYAAEVPLKTVKISSDALKELGSAWDIISKSVLSDYKSARYLLETALRCAAENVYINADSISDLNYAQKIKQETKERLALLETQKV